METDTERFRNIIKYLPLLGDDNIGDGKTFEREVSLLLQIKDAYPKMVIARTRHDEYQHEGVRIVDIVDWLLD